MRHSVLGTAIAVVLAGCSSSPSLQEVILSDLGEPGWEMIVDTEVDDEAVGFLVAVANSEDVTDMGKVEGFWLRVWASETGTVSILAGSPGPLRDESLLEEAVEQLGMERTSDFGSDGIVLQADVSDELGPGFDVLTAKEAHLVFISFVDAYSHELVADTIERQLVAIPEYDPGEESRGVLIAIFSLVFVLALGFAVRSLRKSRPSTNPKESWTT